MELKASLLWATPIVEVMNPDHARLKAGLVRVCYELEKRAATPIESGIAPQLKSNLYESRFDLFNREDVPEIREFRQFCAEALSQTVTRLRTDAIGSKDLPPQLTINIFESWAHVTRDGGYHDIHLHPNCSWCGIYYLEPGDCTYQPPNGVNRFFPPSELQYVDFGAQAYPRTAVTAQPGEGKLVLFPSYVAHSATPYHGQRDRIVLSFNARVFTGQPNG
jgi:uncharacterized protein (TIGR02466 family)